MNRSTVTFEFSFKELQVQVFDLEEVLGFEEGNSPDPFPELYQVAIKQAAEVCDIRCGYTLINNVVVDRDNLQIRIGDQVFNPGKIVVTQLKVADSCAVYTCTAGSGITDLARKTEADGDFMLGYVLDVVGTVTVNKACEKLHELLADEIDSSGLSVSDSYSPGYCDWSVAEQQKLFSLLPADFCGIKLSESSLMNPIKSVSGIIGIGEGLERKGYQCHWCTDADCFYGKIRKKRMAREKQEKGNITIS